MAMEQSRVRAIVIIAVFSVLSAIGGLVKLGTPIGSIALDSWPGFFVAAYYSPLVGGLVGGLGHLASAATAGFPLDILHIPVAIMQAIWSLVFGLIIRGVNRRILAPLVATPIAVFLNGYVAPHALKPLRPAMADVFTNLVPFLLAVSAVNVVIAACLVIALARSGLQRL